MSRIRNRDTKAELVFRKALWKNNIRFRIHANDIKGKPDIIIHKYRLVIFIDGAFWHGYNWDVYKRKIHSNTDFWFAKIEENIRRDKLVNQYLLAKGYTVMRFWDHEIFKELPKCLNQVQLYIESCKLGAIPENL